MSRPASPAGLGAGGLLQGMRGQGLLFPGQLPGSWRPGGAVKDPGAARAAQRRRRRP